MELQALQAVSERMAGCSYGTPSRDTIEWFLRDRKYDVEDTVGKLEKMMKWRQDFK